MRERVAHQVEQFGVTHQGTYVRAKAMLEWRYQAAGGHLLLSEVER